MVRTAVTEEMSPRHHPAIRAHQPAPVLQRPEFTIDFLGVASRVDYYIGMMTDYVPPPEARMITPSPPGFDEEYFEWIDLFESVAEAASEFVMVELGAGFGRWLMRGAAAVRCRGGCSFRGVGVEAEPEHFRWLKRHLRDNGVAEDDLELIWAAVGPAPGFVPFFIGNSSGWYGQAVARRASAVFPDARARRRLKARSILGRPPVGPDRGERDVWVPSITLDDVLAPYPRIDLMDLDIQGLELDVLSSAIDLVNARVRRIHIGTHSSEVEQGLRTLFDEHRWQKLHDYPCQSQVDTPYGDITFGDGVQTWLNPALAPPHARPGSSPPYTPSRRASVSTSATTRDDPEQLIDKLKTRNEGLRAKNQRLRSKLDALRIEYRAMKRRRDSSSPPGTKVD
jgi:FkbM family methyltransferase